MAGNTHEPQDPRLAELIAQVQRSRKYQAISPALLASIGRRELQARRSLKEAVKATKNKLHQVAGAYLDERPPYASWQQALAEAAAAHSDHALRQVCQQIMQHHASTRERLPILEEFYSSILAALPAPPRSVLDLACGFNPLARPWLPLAPDAAYYACDIYQDMIDFLNQFFALTSTNGQAFVCDLSSGPPAQRVDLALALKLLPPLEQLDKAAAPRLLDQVQADYVLVSFPAHSLGGRARGMTSYYAEHFAALLDGRPWRVQRFDFASELAFLVQLTA